jgi:hypothetical protein
VYRWIDGELATVERIADFNEFATGDRIPADRATAAWETALAATRNGPLVWFHGDVALWKGFITSTSTSTPIPPTPRSRAT